MKDMIVSFYIQYYPPKYSCEFFTWSQVSTVTVMKHNTIQLSIISNLSSVWSWLMEQLFIGWFSILFSFSVLNKRITPDFGKTLCELVELIIAERFIKPVINRQKPIQYILCVCDTVFHCPSKVTVSYDIPCYWGTNFIHKNVVVPQHHTTRFLCLSFVHSTFAITKISLPCFQW